MSHKIFTVKNTIRFNHCDPAGIVFFPRYFEMMNRALEKFFTEILGKSFQDFMNENIITPTCHISSDFILPCRLEEKISIHLTLSKISRSTAYFNYEFEGEDGGKRLNIKQIIVMTDHQKMKSISIPEEIRKIMEEYLA